MSDAYVFEAVVTIGEGARFEPEDDTLYMLDGSENHTAMEAYLDDPEGVDVPGDDSAYLAEHVSELAGRDLHIYALSITDLRTVTVSFDGRGYGTDLVLSPYGGLEFTVKVGDTFTVSLGSSVGQSGEDCALNVWTGILSYRADSVHPGETWSETASATDIYHVGLAALTSLSGELYVDFTLEYDGASVPNGSAALFAAICIAIALLTVLLIAINAMRPSWSKRSPPARRPSPKHMKGDGRVT